MPALIPLILQVIVALPKLFELISSAIKSWQAHAALQEEAAHRDAMTKLKNSKTEQEQKDALNNIVDHP